MGRERFNEILIEFIITLILLLVHLICILLTYSIMSQYYTYIAVGRYSLHHDQQIHNSLILAFHFTYYIKLTLMLTYVFEFLQVLCCEIFSIPHLFLCITCNISLLFALQIIFTLIHLRFHEISFHSFRRKCFSAISYAEYFSNFLHTLSQVAYRNIFPPYHLSQ